MSARYENNLNNNLNFRRISTAMITIYTWINFFWGNCKRFENKKKQKNVPCHNAAILMMLVWAHLRSNDRDTSTPDRRIVWWQTLLKSCHDRVKAVAPSFECRLGGQKPVTRIQYGYRSVVPLLQPLESAVQSDAAAVWMHNQTGRQLPLIDINHIRCLPMVRTANDILEWISRTV